jgi:hypothetical protein
VNLDQPANHPVLESLARRGPGRPLIERHDAVPNAYLACGCHPDVVERLWDELGKALRTDCRWLIHHTPVLVHPKGLILAAGTGTRYALRLPPGAAAAASSAGLTAETTWSGGQRLDLRAAHGPDWVFGAWVAAEAGWVRAVYDAASETS